MPSTHKRRLSDFLKAVGRSATSTLDGVEVKKHVTEVNLSATEATGKVIFHAEGPCVIRRILLLPVLAIASHSTDKWVITFTNKGIAGVGATALGTFSTYASDSATRNSAVVAFDAEVLFQTVAETELVNDAVLTLTAVKGGSAADILGQVVVEYISLID
jgi:hypothetical protein